MLPTPLIYFRKNVAAAVMSTALVFLITGYAAAGDMISTICNKHVVSAGDMKAEVLAKCGKPLSRTKGEADERTSATKPGEKGKRVRVKKERGAETWTYELNGSYHFFIFSGGRLEKIRTGSAAD